MFLFVHTSLNHPVQILKKPQHIVAILKVLLHYSNFVLHLEYYSNLSIP